MDNFSIIYKILKALEKAMDFDEFDVCAISHERLGITYRRWERILIMLERTGYIEGVDYARFDFEHYPRVRSLYPSITLKGLEYLVDNTLMRRAGILLKEIKDAVPGL